MGYMRANLRNAGCWVFLGLLGISNIVGDQAESCIKEFGGVGPGENLTTINENNYINLTVSLQEAYGCDVDVQNNFTIRLSYQPNNIALDLCKFVFMTACELSHSSKNMSSCRCLNNHTFQIFQKAKRSDSGLYTWKWRYGKGPEKQRNIFINVRKGSIFDDTATKTTTATVICVLFSVVAVVTAVVVFWVRHKAKCSMEAQANGRHYSWSEADNQVNCQASSDASDPYYSVVEEGVASQNHDPMFVKEQDFTEHYNTSYADVKEHDSTKHYDPYYAEVKEQDESQPCNPTYHEMKIEENSAADEPYYVHVNKQKMRILDNSTTVRC